MAGCCSCFRKKKSPKRKVTLLLVGLDNAGKTTAIKGIQGESQDDVAPTVGFSSIELQLDNFEITVYDLGGGRKIRSIWQNYYAEVHGIIFVIDASAEDRLSECQETLETVLSQEYVKGKRVLILANKQDQEGALDEIDICDQLDLETMVNNSKCPCRVETCSAIQGSGKKVDKSLREGFRWLLQNISSDWEDLHTRVEEDMIVKKEAQAAARKARLERARKAREEREKREAEERKARGEEEEEQPNEDEDEENMQDPFKKVDSNYFAQQEKKKAAKQKKKKEKNGAVVVDVDGKGTGNGQVGVREDHPANNGQQTFVNNGYEEENNERINGQSNGENRVPQTSSEDVVDSTGRTEPDGSQETGEGTEPIKKEKKKKKGKKVKKKNKVGQMPIDGDEDAPAPSSPRPMNTPAWAAPPGQRSLFRASQRPTLETLPEQHSPRSSVLPPISGGSGRGGTLPEIRPTGAKPNSEEDEGVVT